MAEQGYLLKEHFDMLANITNPVTMSPILDVKVPRGQAWLLPSRTPIEMAIMRDETHTSPSSGNVTFQLLPFMDISFLSDNQTVQVFNSSGEEMEILDVDYQNHTVTIADAEAEEEYKFFVPINQGVVSIRIAFPAGSGTVESTILNRNIQSIHGINQFHSASPLLLKGHSSDSLMQIFGGQIITESMRLQVCLQSKYQATTDPICTNYFIRIPYRIASIHDFPANIKEIIAGNMINKGGR